ncbi:hypothetical protein GCM10023091_13310 [Ravibacter arvi]|uniref:Membrane protein required for colicin V production n=1 Tax=Ravibacter arvi TaxID=2051041 RepID=A0ABP8LVM1_9BACT
MKLLDILIAVPLLWGAVSGYKKGLLIEVIGIAAFVTAIVLGFKFLGLGMEILEPYTSEQLVRRALPFLGFAVIFFPTIFLINQFGYWMRRTIKMTLLGTMDSLSGAVVGVFTWVFGVSVFFWLLTSVGVKIPVHRTEDTYLYPLMVPVAPVVVAKAVELLPASHRLIMEWKKQYLDDPAGGFS